MPPLRKQARGKGSRNVNTPKRFKNGACVNTPILATPTTRGASSSGARDDRETPDPTTISETTKQLSNKEKFDYLAGKMDHLMTIVTALTNCMKVRKRNIVDNLSMDDEGEEAAGSDSEGDGGEMAEGGYSTEDDDINPALFESENKRYKALASELDSVKKMVSDLKDAIELFTSGPSQRQGASKDKGSNDRIKHYDEKIKHITDQMENDKQELKTILDETKNEMKQAVSAIQNSGNIPRQLDTRQPQPQTQQQQHGQPQQQQTLPLSDPSQNSYVPGNSTSGNYSEHFLNRMRSFRSTNLIIFNLSETEDERVNLMSQRYIDEQEIGTILEDIGDDDMGSNMNLMSKVVEITRLGRKSEGKIRPVRVRFESVYYRDAAVMNGFRLKYRDDYFNKVKMCKDLIREDREKAKAEYERKKQLKLANANGENRPVADSDQTTPISEINRPVAASEDQVLPRQAGQINIT